MQKTLPPAATAWHPIALTFLVNGGIFGVWAALIPLTAGRLNLNPQSFGIVLFLLGAGAVSAMMTSGWLIRRIGSALLIRITAAVFCITLPLVASAPQPWILCLVILVFGASGGSMDVAMNAAASDVEKRAGRAFMSSFHGMWSLGGLAGATLATGMFKLMNVNLLVLIMSVLFAGIFAWAQRGLYCERTFGAEKQPAESLWPSALALVIGISAGLCFAAEGAVTDWVALFIGRQMSVSVEMANAGYIAFAGAMAAGRFCGDAIRNRVGGLAIIRGGCGLAFIGVLAGPLSGNAVIAISGCVLAGLGLSNIVPVLFSSAGRLPHPATQIAAVSTLGYGGLLLVPPLLGFIGHTASLASIFYATAVMLVVIFSLGGLCTGAWFQRQNAP